MDCAAKITFECEDCGSYGAGQEIVCDKEEGHGLMHSCAIQNGVMIGCIVWAYLPEPIEGDTT